MPLIWQQGPFIYNYLKRLDETIQGALQDHANIIAVRVDLRFPFHFNTSIQPFEQPLFSRFIASLKAKIATRRAKAVRNGKRFHSTKVHYAGPGNSERMVTPTITAYSFSTSRFSKGWANTIPTQEASTA